MDPKITQSHVESWLPNLMYHSGPEGSTIVHEYQKFISFFGSNFRFKAILKKLLALNVYFTKGNPNHAFEDLKSIWI